MAIGELSGEPELELEGESYASTSAPGDGAVRLESKTRQRSAKDGKLISTKGQLTELNSKPKPSKKMETNRKDSHSPGGVANDDFFEVGSDSGSDASSE